MRRYVGVLTGLCLAGCASAHGASTAVRVTGVAASCAAVSPAQQFAAARLVFIGVALPGPTAHYSKRPVLASPARMRVERYLKGDGPQIVRVDTAVTIEGSDSIAVGEDGIDPSAGERWKIYTGSRRQPFATSICGGSKRVASGPAPAPSGRAALALWRGFPVHADPRPIVAVGEGIVLDPASGFPTDAAKLAYMEGHFVLRAPLPGSVGNFGRYAEVPATVAYRRLRAGRRQSGVTAPPLIITAVHIGTARFLTDRGPMRLPAWQFHFKGVADPASVLAVAAPDLFTPPPLHRFGPPGSGNSIEGSATVSPSGTTIKLTFSGAPPGSAPCEANYRVSAVSSQQAVAFTITRVVAPVPPGQACPALAVLRTAVLHLDRPLGSRVLISATDGGAVPVTR